MLLGPGALILQLIKAPVSGAIWVKPSAASSAGKAGSRGTKVLDTVSSTVVPLLEAAVLQAVHSVLQASVQPSSLTLFLRNFHELVTMCVSLRRPEPEHDPD